MPPTTPSRLPTVLTRLSRAWAGALGLAAALVVAPAGCFAPDAAGGGGAGGADAGESPSGGDPLGPAVGQGGAQDFGQFRAILEAGDLPGPDTIDDVGFFAEHRISLGTPECEDNICLHGQLGVMGNFFSGANCTMVMLGLTTPLAAEDLEDLRMPLNLTLAIDTSGSMHGQPIAYVREGLLAMRASLRPEDRITLISFSDQARVLADAAAGDDPALTEAIEALEAEGQTNLYAGLRAAYEHVDASASNDMQNRIVLLSDGESTTGILNDDRMLALADAYAPTGISVSTIGVGRDFNPTLMRGLSEKGAGAFYFLEDPAAVTEVFVEEVDAFLVPLAREVTIEARTTDGYAMRGVFGTPDATITGGTARIEIPTLQLAHRTSVDDNEEGRRGGGGAIVLELEPQDGASGEVGSLHLEYRDPQTDAWVEQDVMIDSPLRPGETPTDGFFSADGVRKAFVTLNLYAGFEQAAVRVARRDLGGALGILLGVRDAVEAELEAFPDSDIADDLRYVDLFIANLEARGAMLPRTSAQAPADPWPQD